MKRRTLWLWLSALLLLLASDGASAASGQYGEQSFHPFTLASCTPPTEGSHELGNCDPVNLIFPGKTWLQVASYLGARGWTAIGLGDSQRLHIGDDDLVVQDIQLFRADGLRRRYHIRLWQGPGPVTIAAVHHEEGLFLHELDRDWEDTEGFVAGQLCPLARACRDAYLPEQDAIQGNDGEWRGLSNDARATVIVLR